MIEDVLFLLLFGVITSAPLMAKDLTGEKVFYKHCIHCHASGDEYTGTRQLAVTRGKDYAVLQDRKDLNADYIRIVVRQGLRSMPPFLPSDLTDDQLKALTGYLTR